MICRVFINFNVRLSIIAVGISSTLRDRHFTTEDWEDDKSDDEPNELSIEIALPWQMTQRKAAIDVEKRKKKEGRREEGRRWPIAKVSEFRASTSRFPRFVLWAGMNPAALSQIIIRALIKRRANSHLCIPLHRISSTAGILRAREDPVNGYKNRDVAAFVTRCTCTAVINLK